MKLIFMGTPEFAVPALKLLAQHHEIIAVYTQPPKPAGRGYTETLSPIHQLANQLNLSVYTPKTLRKEEAQKEFANLEADCTVVVAYGLILPKEILNACPKGCINIHPSSLPKFRGAAPIQRTILAGEKETSVCIMQMDEGVDTGNILRKENYTISDQITYPELAVELAELGAQLVLQTINNLKNITPQKQSEIGMSYASKITKEEGELKWEESAETLMLKVRALQPWPGTYFIANDEKIKVLAAKIYPSKYNHQLGTIVDQKELIIACAHGLFQPLILQRPGKQAMKTQDFLRGYLSFPNRLI